MSKRLFYKHFSQIFFGGLSGQVISLLSYPVLARLYSPSEYGVFTVLSTFSIIFGGISCGTFDYAIQASKSYETNALYNLAKIFNLIFTLCMVFFSLIVGLIFDKNLYVILLVSTSIYLVGSSNALMYFLLKNEKYKQYSYTTITRVFITVIAQIGLYYYFKNSFIGLLSGFFIGYLAQILFLYKLKSNFKPYYFSFKKIKFCYKKYNKFLKVNLPSNILNSCSINGLLYVLFFIFGEQEAGIYSMANRIIGLPLTLISGSLSQVFFQKASKAYHEKGTFYNEVKLSLTASFLSLLLIAVIIFVVAKWFVGYYLGDQWAYSSSIIFILMPVFFGRFLCSNLTTIPLIINKPKFLLVFNAFLILATFFPLLLKKYFDIDFFKSIFFISLMQLLIYMFFLIFLVSVSKKLHFICKSVKINNPHS